MLSATATSIVQLIGIITMTTSLSNDGHLQAVAPKIPALHKNAILADENHDGTDGVEPHTVLILFRTCDYLSSQGWPPEGLEKDPGFLYVQVSGERIEIVPEGNSSASALKPPNPVKRALNIPYLRHLKDSCPEMTDVNNAFKEPDFSGAATVIDLPIGTVDACTSNGTSRIDTRVTIPNDGHIIIHATRPTDKRIVLAGNAKIYVAHVPRSYIKGPPPPEGRYPQSHFNAYFSMSPSHDCGARIETARSRGLAGKDLPALCVAPLRPGGGQDTQQQQQPPIAAFIDMQCSTTSWP